MSITVLWGPPCSGKSTYIRERAQGDDIVIDLDRIALAVAPEGTDHHGYAQHHRKLALDAREAMLIRALSYADDGVHLWVIDSNADKAKRAEWRLKGAQVVEIDVDRATCEARAQAERPESVMPIIAKWFARHRPDPGATSRDW